MRKSDELLQVILLWVMTACDIVGGYQGFGEACFLPG